MYIREYMYLKGCALRCQLGETNDITEKKCSGLKGFGSNRVPSLKFLCHRPVIRQNQTDR